MGDLGLIPGLGTFPGEGNGYPLKYSGLENSMDCVVLGVAKSDFHFKVYIQHLDPFIIKWTLSMLPCLGYCK